MKHISELVQKIMQDRQLDWDRQNLRTDEPSVTDRERERVRQVIRDVIKDREEMDRQYVQERIDHDIYEFEPYIDALRPKPINRPHTMKSGGLAEKAYNAMLEARYGKK